MSESKPVVKILTSSDGTQIYADAVGNPSRPHIVFVHGISLSAAVFDKIFLDPEYQARYYLVRCLFCKYKIFIDLDLFSLSLGTV